MLWKIWSTRNKYIFDGEENTPMSVAIQSQVLLNDIKHAYGDSCHATERQPRTISWNRPSTGFFCLNVGGSVQKNTGRAGVGGLVRDHIGSFICGFHGSLATMDVTQTEVLGLLHGISICWDMGFIKIICYSDSQYVIDLINKGNQDFHRFGNEVAIIRSYIKRDWDFHLFHIWRERNHCADLMAKMGAQKD